MKQVYQFLFSLLIITSFCVSARAQVPQKFNYQGVARDGEGILLAETALDVRLSIREGSETGTIVWSEIHSVQTNALGLFSLEAGSETATPDGGSLAAFTDIDWGSDNHFLQVELKKSTDPSYQDMGTQQFLSVPYALFAASGNEGPAGRGISSTTHNPDGSLTLHFTDGTSYQTGDLTGDKGDKGDPGTGLTNRGEWVSGIIVNEGDYVFDRTAGDPSVNSMWIFEGNGPYTSASNPYLDTDHWIEFQAPAGPQGEQGSDGEDGRSVTSVVQNADSTLTLYFSDATSYTTGKLTGPRGLQGIQGEQGEPGEQGPPGPEASDDQMLGLNNDILSLVNGGNVDLTEYKDNTDNQSLTLSGNQLSITRGNNVDLGTIVPTSPFSQSLDTTYLTNGSLGIGTNSPMGSKLAVVGDNTETEDPLFVVRRKDGKPVFAVYNEGVRVYLPDEAKGRKGGFAIGGFSDAKGETQEYFSVTPDSTRIIFNETDHISKGVKGGFAIGGFNEAKGVTNHYMAMSRDSTRLYLNENPSTKGRKGGFAIGGFSDAKGYDLEYLRVTNDSTRIYVDEDPETKGLKGGFAIGGFSDAKTGTGRFMSLTPVNYYIGHESGMSSVNAQFNSFFGYQAGQDNESGNDNVFIGFQSGQENVSGDRNVFMGKLSGQGNFSGYDNVFIGHNAGSSNYDGYRNVFIGEDAGNSNHGGDNNVFMGHTAGGSNTSGGSNVFIGQAAGANNTEGGANVFIGDDAGLLNQYGSANVMIGVAAGKANLGMDGDDYKGKYNVYMGYLAAWKLPQGQSNVIIGNQAGFNLTEGNYNLIMGRSAGAQLLSASGNVMMGPQVAEYKTGGNNNVFLGNGAGSNNADGNSNIFIGYNAGYNESGSSKLYIQNSNEGSTSALIYGDFSSDELRFNANIGVRTAPDGSYAIKVTGNTYSSLDITAGSDLRANDHLYLGEGSLQSTTSENYIRFDNRMDDWYVGTRNRTTPSDEIFYISNTANGDGLLTLDHFGNMGLGILSPSYPMHIYRPSGLSRLMVEANSGAARVMVDGSSGSTVDFLENTSIRAQIGWESSNNYLYLADGGDESLVSKNGRIAMGTNDPGSHKLLVSSGLNGGTGNGTPYASLFVENTSTLKGMALAAETAGTELTALFTQTGTGDVLRCDTYPGGIWTPVFTIKNDGRIIMSELPTSGTGNYLRIAADGSLFESTSSIRYKTNVHDLEFSEENFLNLNPVDFNWKENPDLLDYGLIAEEVENINPLWVIYDQEGKPNGVDYHKINIMLLKVVQNQHKELLGLQTSFRQVEDRQTDIEELQRENENLRNRLSDIEAKLNLLLKEQE